MINQKRHLRKMYKSEIQCSKYPPAFKIDLHVDDSKGVEIEGEQYGFQTIIIDEEYPDWVKLVLQRLDHYKNTQEK